MRQNHGQTVSARVDVLIGKLQGELVDNFFIGDCQVGHSRRRTALADHRYDQRVEIGRPECVLNAAVKVAVHGHHVDGEDPSAHIVNIRTGRGAGNPVLVVRISGDNKGVAPNQSFLIIIHQEVHAPGVHSAHIGHNTGQDQITARIPRCSRILDPEIAGSRRVCVVVDHGEGDRSTGVQCIVTVTVIIGICRHDHTRIFAQRDHGRTEGGAARGNHGDRSKRRIGERGQEEVRTSEDAVFIPQQVVVRHQIADQHPALGIGHSHRHTVPAVEDLAVSHLRSPSPTAIVGMIIRMHVSYSRRRNGPLRSCPDIGSFEDIRISHSMTVLILPWLAGAINIYNSICIHQGPGRVISSRIEEIAVITVTCDQRAVIVVGRKPVFRIKSRIVSDHKCISICDNTG